jgi:hypothetical protein
MLMMWVGDTQFDDEDENTPHDEVHGAAHDAFMTLPPYTYIRKDVRRQ